MFTASKNLLVLGDLLAIQNAPQHAGRIVGDRRQAVAVRRPGDRRDSMSMASELVDQLIVAHSPDVDDAVRTTGRQILAIRTDLDRLNLLTQRERLDQFAFVAQQVADLDCAIMRGADQ